MDIYLKAIELHEEQEENALYSGTIWAIKQMYLNRVSDEDFLKEVKAHISANIEENRNLRGWE